MRPFNELFKWCLKTPHTRGVCSTVLEKLMNILNLLLYTTQTIAIWQLNLQVIPLLKYVTYRTFLYVV